MGEVWEIKGYFVILRISLGFVLWKKKLDCVNLVVDVFDFVLEVSVCMIVCRILNINNIDDI